MDQKEHKIEPLRETNELLGVVYFMAEPELMIVCTGLERLDMIKCHVLNDDVCCWELVTQSTDQR